MAAVSIIVFSENELTKEVEEHFSNKIIANDITIDTVRSFENFYEVIKSKYTVSNYNESYNSVIEDVTKAEKATDITNSTTNTQVENVDESDIVKVDDRYIYYITNKKIVIIDAQNTETSSKIAEINYEEKNFNSREIYVKNNKLIVIGNESYTATCKIYTEEVATSDIAKFPDFKTCLIIYDISNIKEPKEIRRVMVQGSYISSRMIENNIYFVVNQYLYTSQIARCELKDLNEEHYKPVYQDTTISEEERCIGYDKIYCLDGQEASYLILAGLNIENN